MRPAQPKSVEPDLNQSWPVQSLIVSDPSHDLNNSTQLDGCLSRLRELNLDLKNNENNPSGRITVLNKVRENRREIENHISADEWPKVSEELKSAFYLAEEIVEKCHNGELDSSSLNMAKVGSHLEEFRHKVEQIVRNKDTELAKEIHNEINNFIAGVVGGTMDEGIRERMFIENMDETFSQRTWTNPTKAKQFLNQAIRNINENGNLKELQNLCTQISELIDRSVPQPPIPTR
jgi:hypothetical protein